LPNLPLFGLVREQIKVRHNNLMLTIIEGGVIPSGEAYIFLADEKGLHKLDCHNSMWSTV
jgi:hypothetical protein